MKFIERFYDKIKSYLMNEDLWIGIGEGILKIFLIILCTAVLVKVGKIMIANMFKIRHKSPLRISERREATLIRLLDNIITYVASFIALVMVLDVLGVDVKALIAGAGIVGLAVGFGAQNLVRDIITGFFIIFEDQFSVGDYVRTGQFEGIVEEIGLRTTKIKNWTGELHIIPNGNITEVTNFSLNNSIAVVDINIAYSEDIEKAEKVISELLSQMEGKYEEMVNPPTLLGVQNVGTSDVTLRVTCETKPMSHFGIARMLRKEIKSCLDSHGIEVPYPRMVLYNQNSEKHENEEMLGR